MTGISVLRLVRYTLAGCLLGYAVVGIFTGGGGYGEWVGAAGGAATSAIVAVKFLHIV